jgi:hypothetical protein
MSNELSKRPAQELEGWKRRKKRVWLIELLSDGDIDSRRTSREVYIQLSHGASDIAESLA